MEDQAGPSHSRPHSSSVSDSSYCAAHLKPLLTEENLDYFLRQEYLIAEETQRNIDALCEVGSPQKPKNPNPKDEQTKQEFISLSDDDMVVVGQDDDSDSSYLPDFPEDDVNGPVETIKTTLKDVFKEDIDTPELTSLFHFCQTEYGQDAAHTWKERLYEIWLARAVKKGKFIPPRKRPGDAQVSREPLCLKINNTSDSTSADNNLPLNVNRCINGKFQIDSKWENLSFIKYFVNEEEMEIPKEIPISANINNGTCQIQSPSVSSTHLQKLCGLSTASEHTTSTPNDSLIAKKNNNDVSSVRDLALASCSSNDIEYIDADEDCFESPMSKITFYKTDSEDSKKNKTLSSINKTRGNMIDLEDLLSTFTESTNLHIRNLGFENVVPAKSSLKRKISQISNKKVRMSELKFTSVTIFYFERSQGFSSIPTKGGSTLGMENQHFYISTIPIDEYEHRKVQKQQLNLRSSSIIYHRKSVPREKSKNVQALTLSQRIELLESAEVEIERNEEVDCAHIRTSRASAGCDCKEYCDPDVCCCSLSGIECQVDRPNFPCGCSKEHCRNEMGRNEYNHSKVKTHFTKTMRKINFENKGRTSKRKQASPTKIMINNPDIRDINMIEI